MARKPIMEGGKRDEILAAAKECFFEKGYDGTSVRAIMRKAGGEIGLFYYYFGSKDDVFDHVLDSVFAEYRHEFEVLASKRYRDPFRTMTRFIDYFADVSGKFQAQYAGKLHRTVQWALRERALTLITPFFHEIIETLIEFGATPPLGLELTAEMVAHGVGSAILHEDTAWTHRNIKDIDKAVFLLMGLKEDSADLMFPLEGEQPDVPAIVSLAENMGTHFPGYSRSEFTAAIKEKIKNREILVIRHEGNTVGSIAFSRENKEIDFLAVDRKYQHKGIASRLLATVMSEFPPDTELSAIAYHRGDTEGEPAWNLYQGFSFHESELPEAAGFPCQRLAGVTPVSLLTLPLFKSRHHNHVCAV